VPRILFVPDRFMDYRMWSDIPDRLAGRAEIVHVDQREQIPWGEADEVFVAATRHLAAGSSKRVVAAAGQAARFGFALAEAGLAEGLAFFTPSLDRLPDGSTVDFSALDEVIRPYEPIVDALDEPDPARQKETLLAVLRETAGLYLEPAQVEIARDMMSDHADEYFAHLRALAAEAEGPTRPDPPWVERPWVDRLGELAVPVTVVGSRGPVWETIARRARDAEITVAAGTGLAPAEDRARAADALVRTLDRISCP